jgi:uncharacterized protein YuzE
MDKDKVLNEEGIFDYDFVNDILFFKVKNREYSYSIELLDYVIDVDEEGFIVGLQIFDASKVFNMSRESLRIVKNWKLRASVKEGILEVKLVFESMLRNKIVEKNPILVQRLEKKLPNSSMLCTI